MKAKPHLVHTCVRNDLITVVEDASQCKNNEVHMTLASGAVVDLLQAQVDGLQTAVTNLGNQLLTVQTNLDAEIATRTTSDADLHL